MQYNEIYNICQPVMDWLKEQYPNGHKILIDTNSAELMEHGKLMVLDKDLKEMFKPNIVNNEEPEVCNCSKCSCDRQKDDKPEDSQDYKNTINKLKSEIQESEKKYKISMMHIDDVLMEFLCVTHEVMDNPSDFKEILKEMINKSEIVAEYKKKIDELIAENKRLTGAIKNIGMAIDVLK